MKKIIALILALLTAFTACSFADETEVTWDEMGITVTYPEMFFQTKGAYTPLSVESENGVCSMVHIYIALSEEQLNAYNEKSVTEGLTEEETDELLNSMGAMCVILSIDGNRSAADLMDVLNVESYTEADLIPVGKHGDVSYYAVTKVGEDYANQIAPEYAEEFRALQASLVDALKNAEYFTPTVPGGSLVGKTLSFEAKDVDGNPVGSGELFGAHAVTMVNIWATWCGPCKAEMPELGELGRRLEADGRDAAVVGICCDVDRNPETCKKVLEETNVDYLNLFVDDRVLDDLNVNAIPMTLFVGRDGRILTAPVYGVPSDLSFYDQTIDSLLASGSDESAKEAPAPSQTKAEEGSVYRVIVTDNEGTPVESVMVQFCDDTACMMGFTDADGAVSFPDAAEGHPYTVHILSVPDGYQGTEEEYGVPSEFCDTTVVLQKAA